jgi:hypothetical protein
VAAAGGLAAAAAQAQKEAATAAVVAASAGSDAGALEAALRAGNAAGVDVALLTAGVHRLSVLTAPAPAAPPPPAPPPPPAAPAAPATASAQARATALGLLLPCTHAGAADAATLAKAVDWCEREGAESVSDIVESGELENFLNALGLKSVPKGKLRGALQTSAAGGGAGAGGGAVAAAAAAAAAGGGAAAAAAARIKRWGDGLDAPAAGSRSFFPQGFQVTLSVPEAVGRFGHSDAHVASVMADGRSKAATSPTPLGSEQAAALYAYTEETPLYGTLNYTMRTPHTPATPTDAQLKRYLDYIWHTTVALNSLPTHVSEVLGNVYRGIKVLLNPDVYAPGKRITWQAFSSSTKKQTATLDFVDKLPGRKLSGSLFVIDSITAKDIRHFSAIPSEEEVLFPPNSQFKVEKVVSSNAEKKATLSQLGAYDMADLDVYLLRQVA